MLLWAYFVWENHKKDLTVMKIVITCINQDDHWLITSAAPLLAARFYRDNR